MGKKIKLNETFFFYIRLSFDRLGIFSYLFLFRGYGGAYDREFEREFDRPPPSRSHGKGFQAGPHPGME